MSNDKNRAKRARRQERFYRTRSGKRVARLLTRAESLVAEAKISFEEAQAATAALEAEVLNELVESVRP